MVEIPNAFGGFAPFPNTIMIPTMGLQSAVIGYRFGFGYEQGKRTLRAMSNEQFNNLDEEAEQEIFKRHDSAAINYFKTEMHNWVALQNLIIEKSVEIEVMKANRTPSAFREMFNGFTSGFSTQQEEDAKSFFSSIGDPIMKLMAWFSGHRGKNIDPIPPGPTIQEPFQPFNPTPFTPETPTFQGSREKTSKVRLFLYTLVITPSGKKVEFTGKLNRFNLQQLLKQNLTFIKTLETNLQGRTVTNPNSRLWMQQTINRTKRVNIPSIQAALRSL